jgi:hypothetical protein
MPWSPTEMTSDKTPATACPEHLRMPLGLLASLAVFALVLAACSSSSTPKAQTSAVASTCNQVGAVLSDGPDPDADPVGYALAQVDPLRQIRTSDSKLQSDIDDLASAYENFYETNGGAASKAAVSHASNAVNAICPGAAS